MTALSSTRLSGQQIQTPAGRPKFGPHLRTGILKRLRAWTPLAKLVTAFADVVAGLGADWRKRIPTSKAVLRDMLRARHATG